MQTDIIHGCGGRRCCCCSPSAHHSEHMSCKSLSATFLQQSDVQQPRLANAFFILCTSIPFFWYCVCGGALVCSPDCTSFNVATQSSTFPVLHIVPGIRELCPSPGHGPSGLGLIHDHLGTSWGPACTATACFFQGPPKPSGVGRFHDELAALCRWLATPFGDGRAQLGSMHAARTKVA